jgi:hypothetical protein
MTLTFGIYAGGLGGDAAGQLTPGPAERPDRIAAALDELRPHLVRGYLHYSDAEPYALQAPPQPWQYVTDERRLDLVVCFREPGDDLTGWLDFLRELATRYAKMLFSLQIGEEANHAGPGGDGGYPRVRDAIVQGVLAVKALGLPIRVGCNSTPILDPEQEFWTDLGRRGGTAFTEALDYVGFDFFPDLVRPIPPDALPAAVTAVLTAFRERSLTAAGIPPTTPIHITEHGWGTGPDRGYDRQAEVLDTVVRCADDLSATLNIAAYEHFGLRDTDSANPDPFYQLGLLRSDYTPKPAFHTYRKLIEELG